MARARAAAQRAERGNRNGGGEFVCPECGRSFTRAAALGAHRSRAHGVAGSSRRTRVRTRGSTVAASGERTRERAQTRTSTTNRSRSRSRGERTINRDQLLQALFPEGIPAKESVIRSVNSWLDEAERLARMR